MNRSFCYNIWRRDWNTIN